MKTTTKNKKGKKPTADEIAEMAMSGKDISTYFSNRGQMKSPVRRVNVDFTVDMLIELDEFAKGMNISRQAAIKSSLRQVLDQHNLAKRDRIG